MAVPRGVWRNNFSYAVPGSFAIIFETGVGDAGILAAACGGKVSSSFLPSCKSLCHCIGQRRGKGGNLEVPHGVWRNDVSHVVPGSFVSVFETLVMGAGILEASCRGKISFPFFSSYKSGVTVQVRSLSM